MLFSGNYYQKIRCFYKNNPMTILIKTSDFISLFFYSIGCKFFKEMSIIGAECVKAPQDT